MSEKPHIEVLEKMNILVNKYWNMNGLDGKILNDLLRQISSGLYYLEGVRSDYHNKYQILISDLVLEGSSVNKAENRAHVRYPEMYQFRHIMKGGYEVVGAIRSNLAYLRQEMNSINSQK